MKRKQFVLSWGRKTFFGLAWPLISLIGLNYFQGLLFPSTFSGTLYFMFSYVGHYGLLVALTYFLLFVPAVLIFPSYYFSRIWATSLIVLGSAILFIDGLVFNQYRLHINGFILQLLKNGTVMNLLTFRPAIYVLLFILILIIALFIWMRGEMTWRSMQQRFSNQTKNWYLALIAASLLISHGLHIYGDTARLHSIAGAFPLHYMTTAKGLMKKLGYGSKQFASGEGDPSSNFTYPKKKPVCKGQSDKNVLFIVIASWRFDELEKNITPHLAHYAKHGLLFKDHHSGGNNTLGGIFSLFYALPGNYWKEALGQRTSPVLIDEMLSKGHEFGIFSSATLSSPEFDRTVFTKVPDLRIASHKAGGAVQRDLWINQEWKAWIAEHSKKEEKRPFFGFLFYEAPRFYESPPLTEELFTPVALGINGLELNNETDPLPYFNLHKKSVHFVDGLIREVIEDLHQKRLLEKTVVVITADHGQEINDNKKNFWGHNGNYSKYQINVPLLVLWPQKESQVIESYTSHYDITPTLMKELWGCKNSFKDHSYGDDLFHERNQEWHLAVSDNDYGIIDYKKKIIVTIDPLVDYSVTDFSLESIPKSRAREDLVLSILRDLVYFRK